MDLPGVVATACVVGSLVVLSWALLNPGASAFAPSGWSTVPAAACSLVLQVCLVRTFRPTAAAHLPRPGTRDRVDGPPLSEGHAVASVSGPSVEDDPVPHTTPSDPPSQPRRLPVILPFYSASTSLTSIIQIHAVGLFVMAVTGLREISHPDIPTITALTLMGVSAMHGVRVWMQVWATGALTEGAIRRWDEDYPLTAQAIAAAWQFVAAIVSCGPHRQPDQYHSISGALVDLVADCSGAHSHASATT